MTRSLSSRDVVRRLEADGWRRVRQKGSHVQFKHPSERGLVTLKHPAKDIDIATLRSIYRQAGWDSRDRD